MILYIFIAPKIQRQVGPMIGNRTILEGVLMTRIIGIVNLKGGVGKTTTCVNLGAALALKGQRVLLVDLDPQQSLTNWAGIDQWPTISDVLSGEAESSQAVVKWEKTGCWVIPSGGDLRLKEIQLMSATQREFVLKNKLQMLKDFDYIFIDTSPSYGLLTINAICASTEIIIPLQTEILALESSIPFFEVLGDIKERFHPHLKIAGILPCMFDSRTRLSKNTLDQMRSSEYLGPLLFKTFIRKNVKLAETPVVGFAVTRYSSAYGAEDYMALAEEVYGEGSELKVEPLPEDKAKLEITTADSTKYAEMEPPITDEGFSSDKQESVEIISVEPRSSDLMGKSEEV